LSELTDIRGAIVALASGAPPEHAVCGLWTLHHWQMVRSEGLGPWFYKSLSDCTEFRTNSDMLDVLQGDYRFLAICHLRREAVLRGALNSFNARCIPVALLKGAYLGQVVYKDPALRPMADVDLLVREEHFDHACSELENLGFKQVFQLNQDEGRFLRLPVVYGRMDGFPQFIDLHRGIQSMDYYYLPSDAVWNDAVEGELWGCRVFYLSTELNFIHLAIHNLNHRGSLRDWVDLVMILRTMKLDWDRLLVLARSTGVMRPLFWIFRELQLDWNTPPPPEFSASLGSYAPHWLEDRIIRHRLRYFWRLAAKISRYDGWRPRLRYVATKLVPPGDGTDQGTFRRFVSHWQSKFSLFHHLWKRL
jgi:hypothetical protein